MAEETTQRDRTVLLLEAPFAPPYGGIARYISRCVPYLIRSGYRVITLSPSGCNLNPDLGLSQEEQARLRIFELKHPSAPRLAAYLAKNIFGLYPVWIRLLIPFFLAPVTAARELGLIISYLINLEQVCAQVQDFDFIHVYSGPWRQGVAGWLVSKRMRKKLMLTTFGEVLPHNDELVQVEFRSRFFRPLARLALCNADIVASMTDHCLRQLLNAGFSPEQARLVPLVVGMGDFEKASGGKEMRTRLGISDEPMLLFVGHIRARKGPQVLVEGLKKILKVHPRSRLVIVGPDFDFTETLLARAGQLGVTDNLIIHGTMGDDELPALFDACDVFCFSTLTKIECLGLTFVQAMHAGKPVIATRIAAAPEVIRHGTDGFLVEPGDVDDFAARAIELLSMTPKQRGEMGRSARSRAKELFDEEKVLAEITATYETLYQ